MTYFSFLGWPLITFITALWAMRRSLARKEHLEAKTLIWMMVYGVILVLSAIWLAVAGADALAGADPKKLNAGETVGPYLALTFIGILLVRTPVEWLAQTIIRVPGCLVRASARVFRKIRNGLRA